MAAAKVKLLMSQRTLGCLRLPPPLQLTAACPPSALPTAVALIEDESLTYCCFTLRERVLILHVNRTRDLSAQRWSAQPALNSSFDMRRLGLIFGLNRNERVEFATLLPARDESVLP